MLRHILPNSLTPVVTLIPFELAAAIGALTSLDFLGLGVPPDTPSLGELLSQGKENLDAWWISLSTFAVLVITLLLLILIGDALRDALDPRKVLKGDVRMKRLEVRNSASSSARAASSIGSPSRSAPASGSRWLVGESGSGKTVTALSLLRLVEAARLSGEILFEGRNVLAMSEPELHQLRGRDIAVIFQEPMTALNPVFTVGDQIAESLQLHEGLDRDAARAASGRSDAPRRHRRTRAPRPQLSAPAFRRPAPARDDRDGARLQSRSCSSPTSRRRRSTRRSGCRSWSCSSACAPKPA